MDVNPYESPQSNVSAETPRPAVKGSNPWVGLAVGIGGIFLSYCAFCYFTEFEKGNREAQSMPAIFAVPYMLGGKWVACGLTMSLSALAIYGSLHEIVKGRNRQEGK
jgi:hypothetical protein